MGTGHAEDTDGGATAAADLDVPVDRDLFLRSILRELTGTLEEVVGLAEAEGFVSVVADRLGRGLDADYRAAFGVDQLDRDQVAQVLVDLERRLGGDFSVIEQGDERIVLGNWACPFGEKVLGRSSLCQVTSSIFGVIAAENLGYARVDLQETIARGAPGCRVVVSFQPPTQAPPGTEREYYATERPPGGSD